MPFYFNTPLLTTEHLPKLKALIGNTIEKNIPANLKEEYEKLETKIDIKSPFYIVEFTYDNKTDYFKMKTMENCNDSGKELSKELIEFFDLCCYGTHEAYCREIGMIK